MPNKLLEALLPVPKTQGDVIDLRLPLGAKIIKFGFKAEKAAIQAPGQNGAAVRVQPIVLCVGDPQAERHQRHRLLLVAGSEDIPEDAHYVDLITLPDGVTIHLFELGEARPIVLPTAVQESVTESTPPTTEPAAA